MNKRCKYKFNISNISLTKYQKEGNYTGIKLLIYLPSTMKSVNHTVLFNLHLKGSFYVTPTLLMHLLQVETKYFLVR